MPYVMRENGKISGMFGAENDVAYEFLDDENYEVKEFLASFPPDILGQEPKG